MADSHRPTDAHYRASDLARHDHPPKDRGPGPRSRRPHRPRRGAQSHARPLPPYRRPPSDPPAAAAAESPSNSSHATPSHPLRSPPYHHNPHLSACQPQQPHRQHAHQQQPQQQQHQPQRDHQQHLHHPYQHPHQSQPAPPPVRQQRSRPTLNPNSNRTPAQAWSAKVWRDAVEAPVAENAPPAGSTQDAPRRLPHQPQDQQPVITVGLRRATGLSRVPDQNLSRNPVEMAMRLTLLKQRVATMELAGLSLVSSGPSISMDATVKGDIAEDYDAIFAEFRELTMAVTASQNPKVRRMAVDIYESAADASLLGGNLDFYLVCQTRLLSALYEDESALVDSPPSSRRTEFLGYALLYFGVFAFDGLELACLTRDISPQLRQSDPIRYALSVIAALRSGNPLRYISLYKKGNVRQRTILHPVLLNVRKQALQQLIRAYLQLEKSHALKLLAINSEFEFLRLLESHKPDLIPYNSPNALDFVFRIPKQKS